MLNCLCMCVYLLRDNCVLFCKRVYDKVALSIATIIRNCLYWSDPVWETTQNIHCRQCATHCHCLWLCNVSLCVNVYNVCVQKWMIVSSRASLSPPPSLIIIMNHSSHTSICFVANCVNVYRNVLQKLK